MWPSLLPLHLAFLTPAAYPWLPSHQRRRSWEPRVWEKVLKGGHVREMTDFGAASGSAGLQLLPSLCTWGMEGRIWESQLTKELRVVTYQLSQSLDQAHVSSASGLVFSFPTCDFAIWQNSAYRDLLILEGFLF